MNKQTYTDIEETIYSEKLSNGLTVFLLAKEEMSKTYALFSTNYGSIDQQFIPIDQTDEITVPKGVAHFLEHKLFEKEDRDVFADFSKQGASPNAYTSFTKTAYLFSATDQIEKNVNTLLDFVQEPYFSEQSVEKEKGIIAQEIKMYDDQPDWQSLMGTIKGMFHEHPVKFDIAGTVESIDQITKDDLYTCYNTFYHPENMTLFIAGNFNPETMMSLIKENQSKRDFAKMDDLKRILPEEPVHVAMKENKITMPVSIPKCTVGIKELSTTIEKDEFLTKELLQDMFMDHYFSKSGQFYEELYKEKLIDASFYYDTILEKNFGFSMIGSNTHDPDQFAKKVKDLLLSTNRDELSHEEFEMMKKKKIGEILRSMNSLENIANQYIDYHTMGIDFFNLIPAIQSISLQTANSFIENWISEDRLTVCKIITE